MSAGVTLGSFRRKRLTILNLSAIYTDICIDLTDFPDFYVAPPSLFSGERDDVSIGDESMFQADSIGKSSLSHITVPSKWPQAQH
jgi:hypothetical protein